MKEKLIELAKIIVEKFNFWQLLTIIAVVVGAVWFLTFIFHKRKMGAIDKLLDGKEREISRLSGELKFYKIQLLMKNDGLTLEEAEKIINASLKDES